MTFAALNEYDSHEADTPKRERGGREAARGGERERETGREKRERGGGRRQKPHKEPAAAKTVSLQSMSVIPPAETV